MRWLSEVYLNWSIIILSSGHCEHVVQQILVGVRFVILSGESTTIACCRWKRSIVVFYSNHFRGLFIVLVFLPDIGGNWTYFDVFRASVPRTKRKINRDRLFFVKLHLVFYFQHNKEDPNVWKFKAVKRWWTWLRSVGCYESAN